MKKVNHNVLETTRNLRKEFGENNWPLAEAESYQIRLAKPRGARENAVRRG
jgi:hypothetical protein